MDLQTQALLDLVAEKNRPPLDALAPTLARLSFLKSSLAAFPIARPVASTRDFEIPGPRGTIVLREYLPATPDRRGAMAAMVYLHGGGWVVGSLDTHDVLCRDLCSLSGCAVYSVDYRLAPENPFPAGIEDCIAATEWVAAHAGLLKIDATRIAIGGDSAGGNIAATVALSLRSSPRLSLAYQLLIYPVTDIHYREASHQRCGEGYLLTSTLLEYFRSHYLESAEQRSDWRASPLLARDHSGLPPTLVLTAGFDPLQDEGQSYAGKLVHAGVDSEHVRFEHQIHGFITMGKFIDAAQRAVELCAQRLHAHLG